LALNPWSYPNKGISIMTTVPSDKAFPSQPWLDDYGAYHPGKSGLTKREYFAALAMMGLANDSNWVPIEIAQMSVSLADELIAALNAEGQANG
jgi:hypothetical protein